MSLSSLEVTRIAHLARIGIKDPHALAQDLSGIFSWIDQLKDAKVDHIQLHDDYHSPQMHERQDHVTAENLSVLDNAPEQEHGFFVVPKIIE
jgi:aspartyl-tRNA(Asn)/glutamyl-tRNA(Gln) amidotransferase subunit C